MADEPSWRLKLNRAQVHLDELNALLQPTRESQDYVIRERVQKYRNRGRVWTYRAFAEVEIDPHLVVVIGDFLFNVRSALDHIAVASVPKRRKYQASFPIFRVDPEQVHPGDEQGDADRREAWVRATTGMGAATLAVVRSFQPYNAEKPAVFDDITLTPEDHVLAVLSAFQNADKHRELITAVDGLSIDALTVAEKDTGRPVPLNIRQDLRQHLPVNGAIVHINDHEMNVKAMGSCAVAVRIGNERSAHRPLPGFTDELLRYASEVVAAIEPTLPAHAWPR